MKYIETFFWGIIAALGALFLELVFFFVYQIFSGQELSNTYFVATVPIIVLISFSEELLKVFTISKKLKNILPPGQIVLGSLIFGCGFFLVELFMMILDRELALSNVLENFILHISTAGIIGYSLYNFLLKKPGALAKAFFAVWGIHFFFNWLAVGEASLSLYAKISLLILLAGFNVYGFIKTSRDLPYGKL